MPITLILTMVFFLLSLFFKRSRILFVVQVVWITLLAGFNTNGADFQNNYNTYVVANNTDKWGNIYTWLATLFKINNIDYVYFNFFLVTLCTCLLSFVIIKLTNYPNLVLSMYYIYPFIDNIIQKRGYYAVCILTLGLYFLLKSKKSSNVVLFMLLTLLALQFHASAIIMFTIPFFMMLPIKVERNIVILIIIFSNFLSGIASKVATIVLPDSMQEKNTLYFSVLSSSSSSFHTLVWTIWQITFIAIIYYIYLKKDNVNYVDEIMLKLNLWGGLLVLLYTYDPVFTRVFRPIIILDFIYVANTLNLTSKKLRMMIVVMFVLCSASFIFFDVMSNLGFDYIVLQIFENNLLFN